MAIAQDEASLKIDSALRDESSSQTKKMANFDTEKKSVFPSSVKLYSNVFYKKLKANASEICFKLKFDFKSKKNTEI